MYPFPSASHPEAAKPSTPLRMMVFAIADYFFALPINVVLKVGRVLKLKSRGELQQW
jgi:hypothetical protein